jgi:hypothetical protein
MADHLGFAHFQALFESALQGYVKETGITLAEHPLTVQLQSCNSVGSIENLVQGQAQAFSNFREGDRITKSIKTAVSKSTTLSATAFLGDAFGLVRQNSLMGLPHPNRLFQEIPPANALLASLVILLDVRAALQCICRYL